MAESLPPEATGLAPGNLPIIPAPPKRGAVRALQKALLNRTQSPSAERGLSDVAADAIAHAVADPAETRTYGLRHLSYLRVPGGTFTLFRDRILVNRVITYPVNPRVLDSQRFPAAAAAGASDRLFWPERDLVSDPDGFCQLLLRGDTRLQVSGVLQDHAKRLRQQNKLDTIPELGVLRPIIVLPMAIRTDGDENPPVVALTSIEGSSRTAWSHFAQDLDPAAPLYGATAEPALAQAAARRIAEIATAPANEVSEKELQRARTLLIPAEVIIGFTPDDDGSSTSLTAVVDQLLGLTHIDPPRPWSGQATEAKIGEKILATLQEQAYIDADEHAWLAGMLSPEDARDRGLDPWAARRAARLLWLITRAPSEPIGAAIGEGIRRASFQRRARREARAEAGAALALRAFDADAPNSRAVQAALPRAMRTPVFHVSGSSGNGKWQVTRRNPDELRDAALLELGGRATGPATLELAALAMWGLVTHGHLLRGSSLRRDAGDPRDPEQILTALMASEAGIRVLHRAASDDLADRTLRRIDLETFTPIPTADGHWVPLDAKWLRTEAVPRSNPDSDPSPVRDEAATMTPLRRLEVRLEAVDSHVARLPPLLSELSDIHEADGTPVIAQEGIDDDRAQRWTQTFVAAMTVVHNHHLKHNHRYGNADAPDDESGAFAEI